MSGMLSFEAWKKLLLNDCITLDKVKEYNALGDLSLKILYDSGVDPSVKAISYGTAGNKPS